MKEFIEQQVKEIKTYYQGRKNLTKELGLSYHRIRKSFSNDPVLKDLQYMVEYMEWEKAAKAAAPPPPAVPKPTITKGNRTKRKKS